MPNLLKILLKNLDIVKYIYYLIIDIYSLFYFIILVWFYQKINILKFVYAYVRNI